MAYSDIGHIGAILGLSIKVCKKLSPKIILAQKVIGLQSITKLYSKIRNLKVFTPETDFSEKYGTEKTDISVMTPRKSNLWGENSIRNLLNSNMLPRKR